jgi:hypothetical protein
MCRLLPAARASNFRPVFARPQRQSHRRLRQRLPNPQLLPWWSRLLPRLLSLLSLPLLVLDCAALVAAQRLPLSLLSRLLPQPLLLPLI